MVVPVSAVQVAEPARGPPLTHAFAPSLGKPSVA